MLLCVILLNQKHFSYSVFSFYRIAIDGHKLADIELGDVHGLRIKIRKQFNRTYLHIAPLHSCLHMRPIFLDRPVQLDGSEKLPIISFIESVIIGDGATFPHGLKFEGRLRINLASLNLLLLRFGRLQDSCAAEIVFASQINHHNDIRDLTTSLEQSRNNRMQVLVGRVILIVIP